LPGIEEQVEFTATLKVGEEALPINSAQAVLHHPDGRSELLSLSTSGMVVAASWQPEQPGVYGVDVSMSSVLADGTVVERSTFLALEAFSDAPELRQ
jgi:hypothetical protein